MIEVDSYIEQKTFLQGKVCAHWAVKKLDEVVGYICKSPIEAINFATSINELRGKKICEVVFLQTGQQYQSSIFADPPVERIHGETDGWIH